MNALGMFDAVFFRISDALIIYLLCSLISFKRIFFNYFLNKFNFPVTVNFQYRMLELSVLHSCSKRVEKGLYGSVSIGTKCTRFSVLLDFL